jgi:hypothetical protein
MRGRNAMFERVKWRGVTMTEQILLQIVESLKVIIISFIIATVIYLFSKKNKRNENDRTDND